MNIDDYIASEMEKPFVAGQTDCVSTVDRWVMMKCGFSPLKRFGRPVTNEDTMNDWLSEKGGLLKGAFDVTTQISSVIRDGEPKAGDAGIIIVNKRVCLALRGSKLWWSRDHDGFITCDDSYAYRVWVV